MTTSLTDTATVCALRQLVVQKWAKATVAPDMAAIAAAAAVGTAAAMATARGLQLRTKSPEILFAAAGLVQHTTAQKKAAAEVLGAWVGGCSDGDGDGEAGGEGLEETEGGQTQEKEDGE